eukprot:jgi/Antlo1/967/2121
MLGFFVIKIGVHHKKFSLSVAKMENCALLTTIKPFEHVLHLSTTAQLLGNGSRQSLRCPLELLQML